jgi:hypothetical protein
MRSASALRFSKGCSSLNFDRIVDGSGSLGAVGDEESAGLLFKEDVSQMKAEVLDE